MSIFKLLWLGFLSQWCTCVLDCKRNSIYTVQLHTPTAADFTFTVQSLLVVWSQRPPAVMQMPSTHRPSEQGAVNAVLLLQPQSTDSACQLLQHTPLSQNERMLEAIRREHCIWHEKFKCCHLSDAASPGSSFLCSPISASRSTKWVVVVEVVVRDSREDPVSCNVTEQAVTYQLHAVNIPPLTVSVHIGWSCGVKTCLACEAHSCQLLTLMSCTPADCRLNAA